MNFFFKNIPTSFYNIQKLKKEIENKVLFDKMQNKINEIKILEQLEKFAVKDKDMAELLAQYKNHNDTDVENSPQN